MNQTACCIVGGGPAGVMLALLLVRQGVEVTLLEAHANFEREFRGDSIYPSTLGLLHGMGLSEGLHHLPHSKAERVRLVWAGRALEVARFSSLQPFPYVMQMPQSRLLDFLAAEARKLPNFQLVMGAKVEGLLEQDGTVVGVRYQQGGHVHELRATLTVGCDGRGSRVRHHSGLELGPARETLTDLLWLKLPQPALTPAPQSLDLHLGAGYFLIGLQHQDHWQLGYGIPRHHLSVVRGKGLESLRANIRSHLPWLTQPLESVQSWSQVRPLSVKTLCLPRWHRPGLLLIGDAAHTMSPIGGVGINLAIQDAAMAAQHLAAPLRRGRVEAQILAQIQQQRRPAARFTQWWTAQLETQLSQLIQQHQAVPYVNLLETLNRLPFALDFSARLIA